MAKKLKPIHPGEQLREEFMKPLGLRMNRLAIHPSVGRFREPVAVDFLRYLVFDDFELDVHPELSAVFEVAAKPQGGICGNAAALIHDLGDAGDWHMKVRLIRLNP